MLAEAGEPVLAMAALVVLVVVVLVLVVMAWEPQEQRTRVVARVALLRLV
jgi:hypothetical protein